MKDILKTTAGVLLAAIIVLGCWIGVRAWEVHQERDLLTEIINVRPVVYPTDGQLIDDFGRITLTMGSGTNYEYVIVKVTITYDTYIKRPNGKGDIISDTFEDLYFGFNNVTDRSAEKIQYQLTPEQLEHLENVYYKIEQCKIK